MRVINVWNMEHTKARKYIFTGHKYIYYLTCTARFGFLDNL